jgi:hypothetical protein
MRQVNVLQGDFLFKTPLVDHSSACWKTFGRPLEGKRHGRRSGKKELKAGICGRPPKKLETYI